MNITKKQHLPKGIPACGMHILLSLIILCGFHSATLGQEILLPEKFSFEEENMDASVPSPEKFLGYELGTAFTLYAHTEAYLKAIAEASPRIALIPYGSTYEGRNLYALAITSPENQGNLESIRQTNLMLADPVKNNKSILLETAKNHPVTISFSYNIHGNEASGTEAAMQVAYHLAASQSSETKKILDESVVLMFPCINPDGRDRYVYWYKGMRRHATGYEPRDIEHYAPWPNGRTNHYWFDLNRDWIWGVHPESRGQTEIYTNWMPQLHTDYHEMGYNSNYFTVPGTTPRNKLLPDAYEPLADTIGRANARAFDENQVNYYTREAYDFFYPGYGSSYPSVMGAVGMLVEQGGIAGGRAIKTWDDYILTLRQRVWDHYATSLATIKKAVDRKQQFIAYGIEAHDPNNSKIRTKSYIIKNDNNPHLHEVLRILDHHKVEIHQVTEEGTIRATDYQDDKSKSVSLRTGDYIISTQQAAHLLVNSIFQRNMEIEDSVMYDMATWAVPLAYNLDAYYTTETYSKVSPYTHEESTSGTLSNADAGYAYAMDWKQKQAPMALNALWDMGYTVRCATKPFQYGSYKFDRGSIILLMGRNPKKKNISQDLQKIVSKYNVNIVGLPSGRMDTGIDLASRNSQPLKKPKAAMLVGGPFNTYTSGQIYWMMDYETSFPLERIRTEVLAETSVTKFGARYGYASLKDYDVLVLPGGGGGLSQVFNESSMKKLKDWISAGGTLIATESAARFFSKNNKATHVDFTQVGRDTSEKATIVSYEDRNDYFGKSRTPGTALNARVDNTHPLAFGLDNHVYPLKFGNDAIVPNPQFETVVQYNDRSDNMFVAGYLPEMNAKNLSGKSGAGVARIGRGKIVYLIDNTHYRMFWRGPSRMMKNAILLMPSF